MTEGPDEQDVVEPTLRQESEASTPDLDTTASSPNGDPRQLRTLRRLVQRGSAKVIGRSGASVEIPATLGTLLAEIARNMEAGSHLRGR